jgi:hypothetical protein
MNKGAVGDFRQLRPIRVRRINTSMTAGTTSHCNSGVIPIPKASGMASEYAQDSMR